MSEAPAEPRYLAERHAVVTGGGRGIGAAIASHLAALGARVTIVGRSGERLKRTAAAMREGGAEVAAFTCDVTDETSVKEAFADARARFGAPYVLVNNAGQALAAPFLEMTRAQWDRLIAVNLTGTYLCTREVLPSMIASRAGRVINVASTAGIKGYTKLAAYCASKHGVVGLTRALALETAKLGVTINAVCPGYTDTDMAQSAVDNIVATLGVSPEEALRIITRPIPRGSMIQPAEVANAVAWLCSPDATAITGQAIAVAGGEVM